MTTVIYADSLLAVNFSMDFLALYICAKLTKNRIHPLRLALSATVGAVCSLLTVTADAFFPLGVLETVIAAVSALVMTKCAFGGTLTAVVRTWAAYLAVNFGLGGLMTALFSAVSRLATNLGIDNSGISPDKSPAAFALIALISGAVSLAYGKLRGRSASRRTVTAQITAFGTTETVTLLSDSGNLLADPFTKNPVIILSAKSAKWLPEDIKSAANNPYRDDNPSIISRYKLRLIPAGSVTGSGMLPGFVPDKAIVDGSEVNVTLAIDSVSEDYNGCGGIVPLSLLT